MTSFAFGSDGDPVGAGIYACTTRVEFRVYPGARTGRGRIGNTEGAGRRRQRGIAFAGHLGARANEGFRRLGNHGHGRRGAHTRAAPHRNRGGNLVELGHIVGRDPDGTVRMDVTGPRGDGATLIIANEGARRQSKNMYAGIHADSRRAADRDTSRNRCDVFPRFRRKRRCCRQRPRSRRSRYRRSCPWSASAHPRQLRHPRCRPRRWSQPRKRWWSRRR
ncbi:MAG: hypothetical protein MZV64_15850 [Ignavibacteriales bacterium]|nr:hypothetical protein [Ignavibacteriales bacterium]